MTTIWKYQLKVAGVQALTIPEAHEVLTAQFQGEDIYIWVMVDPARPKRKRWFEVIGTGHDMPDYACITARTYVATCQSDGFVWHVFSVSTIKASDTHP